MEETSPLSSRLPSSDSPSATPRQRWWFLARSVGFASVVAILLGYDIGVMSGAILDIETTFTLSLVQKQLVVGSLNFISAFGALIETPRWVSLQ